MRRTIAAIGSALALAGFAWGISLAQEQRALILPEQRRIEVRDPARLRPAPLPDVPEPATVSNPRREIEWQLTLDEAIRTALANAEVIRILAGTTAIASGATIYDPAITNTTIDQNRATFDPVLDSRNTFFRTESPQGVIVNPGPPPQVEIQAVPTEGFNSTTGVSKQFITGGTAAVDVNVNRTRVDAFGLPLNPQTASNTALSLNQPLLQGAGARANLAPIVIARINTERSFFQLKDSVQDMVLGVIEAYWQLSFAHVNVWARQQQVAQGREAFERATARFNIGEVDVSEPAQARVSYETFRANLITAEAELLEREAALRNIMGLPPSDQRRIVPATPPNMTRLPTDWQQILRLAETYRPDLTELKLILEADQQQLTIARNTALPRLDGVALYRWNGLEGRTPTGMRLDDNGQFTDWELGVNFSVPLGLRRERALVREAELLLTRDRANLQQALHAATHTLAANYRNLSQFYERYDAFRRVRDAARTNLERQLADYRAGRQTLYLNVLQAIFDWGNAVSTENQLLIQYNIELSNLERETGTILESHGVRFYEERYRSIGPLGRHFPGVCYPRDMYPGPNADRPPTPPDQAYRLPEAVPVPLPENGTPRTPNGRPLEELPPATQ